MKKNGLVMDRGKSMGIVDMMGIERVDRMYRHGNGCEEVGNEEWV